MSTTDERPGEREAFCDVLRGGFVDALEHRCRARGVGGGKGSAEVRGYWETVNRGPRHWTPGEVADLCKRRDWCGVGWLATAIDAGVAPPAVHWNCYGLGIQPALPRVDRTAARPGDLVIFRRAWHHAGVLEWDGLTLVTADGNQYPGYERRTRTGPALDGVYAFYSIQKWLDFWFENRVR